MEEPKQTDQALTVIIVTITVMVFALDEFLPSEVAIWVLYMLPLGLTRWSLIGQLTFILSGACTVLVVFSHLYSRDDRPLKRARRVAYGPVEVARVFETKLDRHRHPDRARYRPPGTVGSSAVQTDPLSLLSSLVTLAR